MSKSAASLVTVLIFAVRKQFPLQFLEQGIVVFRFLVIKFKSFGHRRVLC